MRTHLRRFLSMFLLLSCFLPAHGMRAGGKVHTGEIFPDFQLLNRRTGQVVRLSDYMGKVVVVECFAWWCSPACTVGTPMLHTNVTLYYHGQGDVNSNQVPVQVITVNFDLGSSSIPGSPESHKKTEAFIGGIGLELVLDDPKREVYGAIDENNNSRVAVINMTTNCPNYRLGEVVAQGVAWYPDPIKEAVEKVRVIRQSQRPGFVAHPQNQLLTEGGTLQLIARAEGLPYPRLQWMKDGIAVPGETNLTLELLEVGPSAAGRYELSATNQEGSTNSAQATVRILPSAAASGNLDTPFNHRSRRGEDDFYYTQISDLHVDVEGRITALGNLNSTFEGRPRQWVVRLLADGRPDLGFAEIPKNLGGGANIGYPLPDGGWLLAGWMSYYRSDQRWQYGLLKLDAAGLPVESFDAKIGLFQGLYIPQVNQLASLGDGTWLITGMFTEIDGRPSKGIARVHGDGKVEAGFVLEGVVGEGSNVDLDGLLVEKAVGLPSGKLLISLNSRAGFTLKRLRRHHADGSLDISFTPPDLGVNTFAVDLQGRIWVSDWVSRKLIRLLPNGARDESFHSPDNFQPSIIHPLPSGGAYAATSSGEILELAPGGGTVTALSQNMEVSYRGAKSPYERSVRCLSVQPDGEVVVGGSFDTVNGHRAAGLLRLHGPAAGTGRIVSPTLQPDGRMRFNILTATQRTHRLMVSPNLSDWREIGRFTGADHTTVFTNVSTAGPTTFIRAVLE